MRFYAWLSWAGLALVSVGTAWAQPESEKVPAATAEATRFARGYEPLACDVRINGAPYGQAVLARLPDGRLLVSGKDLKRWNLVTPDAPTRLVAAIPYYALNALPGYKSDYDESRLTLNLSLASTAFNVSNRAVTERNRGEYRRPNGNGAWLSYDLFTSSDALNDGLDQFANRLSTNALLEGNVFGPAGSLRSTWAVNDLDGERQPTRLLTRFRRDWPSSMTTLEVGDIISSTSLLSRPLYLGGVRFGRNFSTQPGYFFRPLPAISGQADVPSVIDLYVNGVRRFSQQVPAGPFSVNEIPVINGSGELELVVRDAQGREQVIAADYAYNPQMLRPGVSDYSVDLGLLRQNYGRASNDYGAFAGMGTWRYGITQNLTTELHGELLGSGTQGAGGAMSFTWPRLGTITSGYQASLSDPGFGQRAQLIYSNLFTRVFSYQFRGDWADGDYRSISANGAIPLPVRTLTASLGVGQLPLRGSMGLSYLQRIERRGITPETESLALSFATGTRGLRFTVSALHRIEPSASTAVLAQLSYPLGSAANFARGQTGYRYSQTRGNESQSVYSRAQWGQGAGLGFNGQVGVNQSISPDSDTAFDASGSYRGEYFEARAGFVEARQRSDRFFAGLSGSVGAYGGHGFVSRPLGDAFALVDMGEAGIPLRVYGNETAVTRSNGIAVIPTIRPYQRNDVYVLSEQLPINYLMPQERFVVAPVYGSAVLAQYPVQKLSSATVRLKDAQGRWLPAGASVEQAGGDPTPVGKNGLAFLPQVKAGPLAIRVRWDAGSCVASVNVPADLALQGSLGEAVCSAEVAP